jgi:hypothetical protein
MLSKRDKEEHRDKSGKARYAGAEALTLEGAESDAEGESEAEVVAEKAAVDFKGGH